MKTSVDVKTPQKATVHFTAYMDRGTQKAMRRVISRYPDVDISAAEKKFGEIAKLETEKDRVKALREIPEREQDAVFDLQETMVTAMCDRIVLEDESELDVAKYEWFFDKMRMDDFMKLSLCVSAIVAEDTKGSQKKTQKS